jgi:hypothetical protein
MSSPPVAEEFLTAFDAAWIPPPPLGRIWFLRGDSPPAAIRAPRAHRLVRRRDVEGATDPRARRA